VVHGLDDLGDLQQPTNREMCVRLDYLHTPYELLEVQTLRGS
jgi:hypothetical protein